MTGPRLHRDFFARPTLEVAEDLVGRILVRQSPAGTVAGRLVEVEAYCGAEDPASHAYRRVTPRNAIMFGPAGHLYVYFTYGMHHCANIVTARDGQAGAVLLRAVEPLDGLDLMAQRRNLSAKGSSAKGLLAKGPGRLTQAFGLSTLDNGLDLTSDNIWVGSERTLSGPIRTSMRIGVRPELDSPWRFYEDGPWTSGPKSIK